MGRSFYFLGAKEIGLRCLEILDEFCGRNDGRILGVLTNPRGEGIRKYAAERGLQVVEGLEELLHLPPADFLLSVQYHRILKAEHIRKAEKLAVNLHMAPLPEYRGCNQFSYAIVNGDETFGTTLHVMDEGVDTGGIIAERRFAVPAGSFVKDLYDITLAESIEMFREEIGLIASGDFKAVPQLEFEKDRPSSFHLRKEIEDLKKIDLDWPAERILRHVRATAMPGFSPPYAVLNGQKIELIPILKE